MFANVHWKRLECKVKALCADTQTKTLTARKALLENTVMLLPEIFNLGSAYKNYFELVPAVSEILRDEVYRIRHQVYCEELAFEPQRPDRREKDVYDAHSLHLLIRTVQTGNFAGCVRIVRVRPTDPDHPLPFENACAATFDRSIGDTTRLPRTSLPRFHGWPFCHSIASARMTIRKVRCHFLTRILVLRANHDFPTFRLPCI